MYALKFQRFEDAENRLDAYSDSIEQASCAGDFDLVDDLSRQYMAAVRMARTLGYIVIQDDDGHTVARVA